MADAIVSVVLEQLASIVRQQIEQEVTLVWGLSKEVRRLTSNFQAIQAVLVDAEQRQVKETSVRVWLDKLKDVSYDADNLLDEWNTSKLKLQIQRAENALTLKKKVCSFFLSPCFSFRKVVLHRDIALRIKELNESLDVIAIDKERYNFNTITSVEQPRGVETTSFIDEYTIYGRDKEKDALMSKLCESSDEHEGLHTISIVGMGGMGKTTLAQLAFKNNEVKNNFEKRIWVCVSSPFDKLRVANAIIQGLEGQSSSSATLESVLQNIHHSIAGKKILLVLDDVWTEDYINDWEPLYNCLKNCLNGSKIVVTTRNEAVALMMNSIVIPITKLSESECWLLFKHFSFIGRSDDECRELENVGKEIVSKCEGLPLAAKTIGSLLRFKKTRKEWENILNSGMWELEVFEKGIFPPLLLSYNDLPPMVKRCFSYCVIFPKDYQLDKVELIKLWMAQGYLGVEQKREMDIGENCFNFLATRSFFQEFIRDEIGAIRGCKMHDIVHDFGQFLTKNECFAMKENDNDFGDSSINFSFEKVRHLILRVDKNNSFPISICNMKNLRSLLFQFESDMNSFDGVLLKLLDQNTCLRALAMGGTAEFDTMTGWQYLFPIKLERIPKEIRKLTHLRYLDLSKNEALEMLPEELCELYNLQTLNVLWCVKLKELPQGLGKLINLRHLVNDYTNSLRYMPKGIEKLTCLQTLSEFRVSGSDYHKKACSLEFLNRFGHLEGFLGILGLGNVTNVSEAQRIQLKNKKNIVRLELGFGGSDSDSDLVNNEAIIEALQPHPNLPWLKISEYTGNTVLPNWITSLTNLRSIWLFEWINCEQLPPLGNVSSLESIYIQRMNRVKRVGIEFLGLESDGITLSSSSLSVSAFPKLKYLKFFEMEEWEEWDFGIEDDNITILPSLRHLEIEECPKLKILPKQILQMASLEVLRINWCPILRDCYRKGTGENWSDISHIPNIQIDGKYMQRNDRTNMYPTPGF